MTLTVRRATQAQTPLVSSVLTEADAWLRARGEALWQADELAPATLRSDIGAGHYYLGFEGDDAAGVLRLALEDPLFWPDAVPGEAAYVHRLAVRRAWSGGATSRALLTWAASEAARHGCTYLRLDCVAARPKLRAVYERFGFRYHSDHVVGPYHVARYELELAGMTRAQ